MVHLVYPRLLPPAAGGRGGSRRRGRPLLVASAPVGQILVVLYAIANAYMIHAVVAVVIYVLSSTHSSPTRCVLGVGLAVSSRVDGCVYTASQTLTVEAGYAGQAPVRRRRPVYIVHSPRRLHGMRHAGGHDPGEKNIYTVKDWFGPSISYLYIESMYCTCFL